MYYVLCRYIGMTVNQMNCVHMYAQDNYVFLFVFSTYVIDAYRTFSIFSDVAEPERTIKHLGYALHSKLKTFCRVYAWKQHCTERVPP